MSRDDPVAALEAGAVDATAVLLEVPAFSAPGTDACHELLNRHAEINVLMVTYRQSATDRIAEWRRCVGSDATSMAIVTAQESGETADSSSEISVTAERPGDLTGMGIAITRQLSDWAGTPRPTTVCFDSLTTLLQYTDVQTTFRFLHVIVNRLRGSDAVGHFHIDPSAHDEQTIAQLVPIFDVVMRLDGDNEWSVQSTTSG